MTEPIEEPTSFLHCLNCRHPIAVLVPYDNHMAIWAGNVLVHQAWVICTRCGEKRLFVGQRLDSDLLEGSEMP